MSSILHPVLLQNDNSFLSQIPSNEPYEGQGWDRSEIEAIDLKQFRNSDFFSNSVYSNYYFLLVLVPVIGWIALACLKGYHVSKHRSAEKIMATKCFDSLSTTDEKIAVVAEAIKVSGPLAWQYRLELARLHLLSGEFSKAAEDLAAVKEQRGAPEQTGYYNVRNLGLVSFQNAGPGWVDKRFVLKINNDNGEEALLAAAVFAANKQSMQAYDAYNEVIFYAYTQLSPAKYIAKFSKSREHQRALAKKIAKREHLLSIERCKQIIQDEEDFEKRGRRACDGINKETGPLFSFPSASIDWSKWKFDVEFVAPPDKSYPNDRYEVKLLLTPRTSQ
jgi:hypothetical protein